MAGRLIESEHRGRYWWAAQVAAGRSVLDVGCGTGYGAQILANAGALKVIGVDVAADVVEMAGREYRSDRLAFVCADAARLPFEDASFDLAVCFEVIEHLPMEAGVMDELRRVLRPDGIALISSPNSRVYPSGNPHHVHQFAPDELLVAARRSFASATLYHQTPMLCAAILDDAAFDGARDARPRARARARARPDPCREVGRGTRPAARRGARRDGARARRAEGPPRARRASRA